MREIIVRELFLLQIKTKVQQSCLYIDIKLLVDAGMGAF